MTESLTPVIPALFRCPSCNATGIRYEHHDYADEPLGCPDCEGQGIYNVDYAFKIGRLVDRETIDWEAINVVLVNAMMFGNDTAAHNSGADRGYYEQEADYYLD